MNSGVVVEYIRYRIGEDRRAGFEEAYAAAAAVLARSPHCVEYDLARSVDDPACHILRITWTSAADHLHGFRTGEPVRGLDAVDEVGLPSDAEFRAAFTGYLEWGTRLAVHNSQPDAKPAPRAPVPRWGWGVAPPYLG